MFLQVCVCPQGGIPACLAGHMTRQQYISRCTVDVSQLVWRQHTGNIKCMMGQVTWYTPLPLGQTPPPGSDTSPGQTSPRSDTPPMGQTPPIPNIVNERTVRILLECILVVFEVFLNQISTICTERRTKLDVQKLITCRDGV